MKEEMMQILRMVEEGKITAEQAAQLIEAGNIAEEANECGKQPSGRAKWLKVRVYDVSTNKKKVNVSIPLSLVSMGLKLGMKFGLDREELKDFDYDDIIRMIEAGEEGKLVDVVDEEKNEKVEVYVE
ncbi:MAG: hypothetical protein HPY66_0622 [Firmicutes bacterium]|nr:hypothetical protein [Bacillota bacterium]MDI6706808.1 hypothetical protein [Bacillota bacterium]